MSSNTVNGASCSYTNLANYNASSPGTLGQPSVPPTTVTGYQIIPQYSTIGYDALTHNAAPSCSGYFNVTSAYGDNAGNCNTQYYNRPCN